jgi:predicted transcriptional regulator of viral defense system
MVSQVVAAGGLADWLLSRGQTSTTTPEVARLLDVPAGQVRVRLHRLVTKKQFFSPARGLWIPVPSQYRRQGRTPPLHYLPALMQHWQRHYYVGWLSAAELYGAAHQAPQVLQVAVDRRVTPSPATRGQMRFYTRSGLADLPTQQHFLPSGYVQISSPELTALDLVAWPDRGGGMSNIATVLAEMTQDNLLITEKIIAAAAHFPPVFVRRLGYLLQHHAPTFDTTALHRYVTSGGSAQRGPLTPHRPWSGYVDPQWFLDINTEVEPD